MSNISLKKGRPTKYTQPLAKEICDMISASGKGTKRLCLENPHWPCQDTLFAWLKAYPEFSEQYARAKKCQIEFLVDEILEISDDASQDQLIDPQGKIVFNSQAVNRARLKIDTRKWLASKLLPRVYGSKIDDEQETNKNLHQEAMERYKQLKEQCLKEY